MIKNSFFRIYVICIIFLISFTEMIAQINSSPVYADFNHGQKDGENAEYIQAINIITPNCCSEITGKVKVEFKASGMTYAKAYCWNSPLKKDFNRWGYDVNLTPKGIKLKKDGLGSFVIDTDKFPAGPMNIRIYAQNELGQKDYFELQLYNKNGVEWNQGIPDTIPNGAKGLNLIFSDDFDEELSISNDGRNARYNAHKPRFGDFSGWLFSNSDGEYSPFSQIDTYLKISARKPEGTKGNTGLIASVNMDGEGFWVKAPCYLECRLTAQSAPGTWPAFWTITDLDQGSPGDELDIVEAYGGVGQGNPNHPGYSVTSHFWSQNNPDGSKKKEYSKVIPIMEIGGKSYWSTTFHTYGLYIGMEETIYYFDDMEVFRHPTNDVSRNKPHCFLINYAIGGISGWPIDLERYGNGSDMYVDFVRVFATEKINYSLPRPQK